MYDTDDTIYSPLHVLTQHDSSQDGNGDNGLFDELAFARGLYRPNNQVADTHIAKDIKSHAVGSLGIHFQDASSVRLAPPAQYVQSCRNNPNGYFPTVLLAANDSVTHSREPGVATSHRQQSSTMSAVSNNSTHDCVGDLAASGEHSHRQEFSLVNANSHPNFPNSYCQSQSFSSPTPISAEAEKHFSFPQNCCHQSYRSVDNIANWDPQYPSAPQLLYQTAALQCNPVIKRSCSAVDGAEYFIPNAGSNSGIAVGCASGGPAFGDSPGCNFPDRINHHPNNPFKYQNAKQWRGVDLNSWTNQWVTPGAVLNKPSAGNGPAVYSENAVCSTADICRSAYPVPVAETYLNPHFSFSKRMPVISKYCNSISAGLAPSTSASCSGTYASSSKSSIPDGSLPFPSNGRLNSFWLNRQQIPYPYQNFTSSISNNVELEVTARRTGHVENARAISNNRVPHTSVTWMQPSGNVRPHGNSKGTNPLTSYTSACLPQQEDHILNAKLPAHGSILHARPHYFYPKGNLGACTADRPMPYNASSDVQLPVTGPAMMAKLSTSRRRGGGRKPNNSVLLSQAEMEKRQIRRERNKEAAARCRQKRQSQLNDLSGKVRGLEQQRITLYGQLNSIKADNSKLRHLLRNHSCKLPLELKMKLMEKLSKFEAEAEPLVSVEMHPVSVITDADLYSDSSESESPSASSSGGRMGASSSCLSSPAQPAKQTTGGRFAPQSGDMSVKQKQFSSSSADLDQDHIIMQHTDLSVLSTESNVHEAASAASSEYQATHFGSPSTGVQQRSQHALLNNSTKNNLNLLNADVGSGSFTSISIQNVSTQSEYDSTVSVHARTDGLPNSYKPFPDSLPDRILTLQPNPSSVSNATETSGLHGLPEQPSLHLQQVLQILVHQQQRHQPPHHHLSPPAGLPGMTLPSSLSPEQNLSYLSSVFTDNSMPTCQLEPPEVHQNGMDTFRSVIVPTVAQSASVQFAYRQQQRQPVKTLDTAGKPALEVQSYPSVSSVNHRIRVEEMSEITSSTPGPNRQHPFVTSSDHIQTECDQLNQINAGSTSNIPFSFPSTSFLSQGSPNYTASLSSSSPSVLANPATAAVPTILMGPSFYTSKQSESMFKSTPGGGSTCNQDPFPSSSTPGELTTPGGQPISTALPSLMDAQQSFADDTCPDLPAESLETNTSSDEEVVKMQGLDVDILPKLSISLPRPNSLTLKSSLFSAGLGSSGGFLMDTPGFPKLDMANLLEGKTGMTPVGGNSYGGLTPLLDNFDAPSAALETPNVADIDVALLGNQTNTSISDGELPLVVNCVNLTHPNRTKLVDHNAANEHSGPTHSAGVPSNNITEQKDVCLLVKQESSVDE